MGEEGDKQVEEIIKMQMEQNKVRFEGFQEMNKANKEGFQMANEASQKASASREQMAFKRSSSDGTDFSKEIQRG